MPGAFLERDIPTLFASSDFGENADSIVWKGTSLEGIFDDEDTQVQTGEGEIVILPQPMVTVASAKVIGIAEGDTMIVRGVTYSVEHWIDDGTGVIEIFLKDAN